MGAHCSQMAFMSVSHDGYRRNTAANPSVNEPNGDDADTKSGRVEIAFEPFASFHGLVTLQYTNEGGAGEISQNVPYRYPPMRRLFRMAVGMSSSVSCTTRAPLHARGMRRHRIN